MSQSGTVKFFNCTDSYGFIKTDRKGPDLFVHRNSIRDSKALLQGDKVCFDVVDEDGRKAAVNVTGGTGGHGLTFGCEVNRELVQGQFGYLKKLFPDKGFGFLKQDSGEKDVFVHEDALCSTGEDIQAGMRVKYDSVWDAKRSSRKAANVAIVSRDTSMQGQFGVLKEFSSEKSFGFVKQDSGEHDLFLHESALRNPHDKLQAGMRVEYDVVWDENRGSRKASNVAIIENAAVQQESGTLNEDMDDS